MGFFMKFDPNADGIELFLFVINRIRIKERKKMREVGFLNNDLDESSEYC